VLFRSAFRIKKSLLSDDLPGLFKVKVDRLQAFLGSQVLLLGLDGREVDVRMLRLGVSV
jgi:hypothetical protein